MSDVRHLLETVECDLCAHQDEELLYTKPGRLTNYPFRVVRCRNCGLIYLNPRFEERAIADLYDRDYYSGKGFDPYVNYIADWSMENDTDKTFRTEETVRIIQEIAPPPSALLDFGCGLGDLMRQATKHGYRVEGYEVSCFAAEFARTAGFTVHESLDQLPQGQYDIVTAVEVFEHCHSPMKALSAIFKCLKPGGCLYYTTANFDGFYGRWQLGITDTRDGYIVPEGHIYFFSTRVMETYFKRIGFSRVFHFEPKAYQRSGRLFRLLSKLGLIGSQDSPISLLERLSYYGSREAATILGFRKRQLPLAMK